MTETTWWAGIDRRKIHGFEFGHLRGDNLGLNIVLCSFVMQRWILIKDHTTLCLHAEFVATDAKPHYRSYHAGTRNMMLTFDKRLIYSALTYIAVPFLGPQQPLYTESTLYREHCARLWYLQCTSNEWGYHSLALSHWDSHSGSYALYPEHIARLVSPVHQQWKYHILGLNHWGSW